MHWWRGGRQKPSAPGPLASAWRVGNCSQSRSTSTHTASGPPGNHDIQFRLLHEELIGRAAKLGAAVPLFAPCLQQGWVVGEEAGDVVCLKRARELHEAETRRSEAAACYQQPASQNAQSIGIGVLHCLPRTPLHARALDVGHRHAADAAGVQLLHHATQAPGTDDGLQGMARVRRHGRAVRIRWLSAAVTIQQPRSCLLRHPRRCCLPCCRLPIRPPAPPSLANRPATLTARLPAPHLDAEEVAAGEG